MRAVWYLIVATLIVSIWTGCGDKRSQEKPESSLSKQKDIKSSFEIIDIDNRSTTVTINGDKLSVAKVRQPIILLNIFAQWSPPSQGMIPYLDALQKRYAKDIFVIGILVNSDMSNDDLREFMKKHNVGYFISNSKDNDALASKLADMMGLDSNYPIPLTIIFNNNKYNKHYIGATPIEMITVDIEQLKGK